MISILLIVLGLALGSFVNALVWRLHKRMDWVRGRSECPRCHHRLSSLDLVPVLSYLVLRGRCRYCGKPIDDKPWTEIAMPILLVISYLVWPHGFDLAGWLAFAAWTAALVGLLALALYDLKWLKLPNNLVIYSTLMIGLSRLLAANNVGDVLSALAGGAVFGGLFYGIFAVSGGRWIGGGDVKLAFGLGVLAGGVVEAFLTIFLSSLLGLLIMVPLGLVKKRSWQTKVPYGPFLITASYLVWLFADGIIDAYLSFIGLQ